MKIVVLAGGTSTERDAVSYTHLHRRLRFRLVFGYMQRKMCLPSNFCVKRQKFPGDPFMQHSYFTYTGKYIAYIQQLD